MEFWQFLYIFVWLVFRSPLAAGIFEQCNHVVNLKAGQKIYINSPYYPNRYPLGTSCRYTVVATPQNQRLNFKCKIQLNAPAGATRCHNEAFYYNREGSELFSSSEYFCGSGEMERQSFLNTAVISYISTSATTTRKGATKDGNKLAITSTKGGATQNKVAGNVDFAQPTTRPTKTASKVASNIDEITATHTNASGATNVDDIVALVKQTIKTPVDAALKMAALEGPNIELDAQESDSVAYIVGLLSASVDELPPTIDDKLSTVDDATMAAPTSLEAEPRIVDAPLRNETLPQTAKIVSNFEETASTGGGSFSCLVEAIPATAIECDCGWSLTQLKVAGVSKEARINEFTAMAGVMTKQSGSVFCGGTIIHQRYVLSAAHCFVAPQTNRAELLRIVVGEHDTSTVLETFFTRYHDIEAITLHEDFRSTLMTVRHDVALLRTVLPIEWNRSVGPACLPFRSWNSTGLNRKPPYAGQRLETAGWGTTSFGGPQSTRLLKTTLDVLSTASCKRSLSALPTGTFCTFTPGTDTCQYDSGGGLYARRAGRMFAVGIVSYGFACAAQQPSVNARIASYLKWIKQKTPGVQYCKK